MCGSGTFVIEAAEIARNLAPGRDRAFAFEQLPTFDAKTWDALRAAQTPHETPLHFYGSDRDTGAIGMSEKNAASAGLEDITTFTGKPISDITPPDAKPGLVIVNPPYGGRIGDKKPLFGLYGAMGARLMDKFRGWRVGIITTEAGLAKATGLPFLPVGPIINHGGLKVRLYQTKPLA